MGKNISSLLLVGIDLVGLAISAKRAGYRVLSADYFGDNDLRKICDRCFSVIKQKSGSSSGRIEESYDPQVFIRLVKSMAEEERIDAVLLSSGLDDAFDVLKEIEGIAPILGNDPEVINTVRDRVKFFKELKRLGIPHPHTELVRDLEEAKRQTRDIGFPVVIKPMEGFAGSGIRKVDDVRRLEEEFTRLENWGVGGVLMQEYVDGIHASVSFMASSRDARVLTVNEQLLGIKELFQTEPFGYCGNIVPLGVDEPTRAACERITTKISRRFNLSGSNGIDLVISEDGTLNLIEVNPRFQGTLECVEEVLGLNLVKLHVEACVKGSLPKEIDKPYNFCTRLILFASEDMATPDLSVWSGVRDIPVPGSIVEEGEPLCSVVSTGGSKEASLENAKTKAESIYSSIQRARY